MINLNKSTYEEIKLGVNELLNLDWSEFKNNLLSVYDKSPLSAYQAIHRLSFLMSFDFELTTSRMIGKTILKDLKENELFTDEIFENYKSLKESLTTVPEGTLTYGDLIDKNELIILNNDSVDLNDFLEAIGMGGKLCYLINDETINKLTDDAKAYNNKKEIDGLLEQRIKPVFFFLKQQGLEQVKQLLINKELSSKVDNNLRGLQELSVKHDKKFFLENIIKEFPSDIYQLKATLDKEEGINNFLALLDGYVTQGLNKDIVNSVKEKFNEKKTEGLTELKKEFINEYRVFFRANNKTALKFSEFKSKLDSYLGWLENFDSIKQKHNELTKQINDIYNSRDFLNNYFEFCVNLELNDFKESLNGYQLKTNELVNENLRLLENDKLEQAIISLFNQLENKLPSIEQVFNMEKLPDEFLKKVTKIPDSFKDHLINDVLDHYSLGALNKFLNNNPNLIIDEQERTKIYLLRQHLLNHEGYNPLNEYIVSLSALAKPLTKDVNLNDLPTNFNELLLTHYQSIGLKFELKDFETNDKRVYAGDELIASGSDEEIVEALKNKYGLHSRTSKLETALKNSKKKAGVELEVKETSGLLDLIVNEFKKDSSKTQIIKSQEQNTQTNSLDLTQESEFSVDEIKANRDLLNNYLFAEFMIKEKEKGYLDFYDNVKEFLIENSITLSDLSKDQITDEYAKKEYENRIKNLGIKSSEWTKIEAEISHVYKDLKNKLSESKLKSNETPINNDDILEVTKENAELLNRINELEEENALYLNKLSQYESGELTENTPGLSEEEFTSNKTNILKAFDKELENDSAKITLPQSIQTTEPVIQQPQTIQEPINSNELPENTRLYLQRLKNKARIIKGGF